MTRLSAPTTEPKAEPRTISQPHDHDEGEAARVAETVAGGGNVAGWAASAPAGNPSSSSSLSGPRADACADAVALPGRALDPATRRSMESRFGYDFARVRIHDDARAEIAARSIDAEAFTVGEDVVFGSGRYAPSSREGDRLLAHELAHVVQGRERPYAGRVWRQPRQPAAAPTFSVQRPAYEQLVARALAAMSGRLLASVTFTAPLLPILQAMLGRVTWRDSTGVDHGGGVHTYRVPGTRVTLSLRLVLDDAADPPQAGRFISRGTNGTIIVLVRKSATAEELAEVLYHEALHMMTWIINTHGGVDAAAGVERRAVRGLTLSHLRTQVASVRLHLENLAAPVNSRRRAAGRPVITPTALDDMSRWLVEEVQVRAETEVFQQARQVESQRGQRGQVYIATRQYGSINRAMVDQYVFEFSRTFLPGDRTGATPDENATLQVLTEILEGMFQVHVRRRFSLTAYTTGVPRERPRIGPSPLTPPNLIPRIGGSTGGPPF